MLLHVHVVCASRLERPPGGRFLVSSQKQYVVRPRNIALQGDGLPEHQLRGVEEGAALGWETREEVRGAHAQRECDRPKGCPCVARDWGSCVNANTFGTRLLSDRLQLRTDFTDRLFPGDLDPGISDALLWVEDSILTRHQLNGMLGYRTKRTETDRVSRVADQGEDLLSVALCNDPTEGFALATPGRIFGDRNLGAYSKIVSEAIEAFAVRIVWNCAQCPPSGPSVSNDSLVCSI
jgi:hypothetical protein